MKFKTFICRGCPLGKYILCAPSHFIVLSRKKVWIIRCEREDLFIYLFITLTAFPLMNFLMVERKPRPPLVGVSSSTSECLLLVRDGRLARVGFGC